MVFSSVSGLSQSIKLAMTKRPEVIQIIFAIGGLLIGLLVYLLDRQPDTVYFIPDWFSQTTHIEPFFGHIGNYLPTFLHVYVFILLTTAVLQPAPKHIIPVCAAWFTIDSLFEVGQIQVIAQWIAGHVPEWFQKIPFLENTASYFQSGTFDIIDILSIAAGTLCAYLTIVLSIRRGQKNVAHN